MVLSVKVWDRIKMEFIYGDLTSEMASMGDVMVIKNRYGTTKGYNWTDICYNTNFFNGSKYVYTNDIVLLNDKTECVVSFCDDTCRFIMTDIKTGCVYGFNKDLKLKIIGNTIINKTWN